MLTSKPQFVLLAVNPNVKERHLCVFRSRSRDLAAAHPQCRRLGFPRNLNEKDQGGKIPGTNEDYLFCVSSADLVSSFEFLAVNGESV